MPQVNYFALLVAGIASMVIGFVWYHMNVFGKTWMKLSGLTTEDMKATNSQMPKTYGIMYAASLVMAYVLSVFISYARANSPTAGAIVGFWAWLGFIATAKLTEALFERKSMNLYYINAGYHLVTLVVMGAIIAVF